MSSNQANEMVFSACICAYCGCNFKDILIGLEAEGELLCINQTCCLAANLEAKKVGMIPEEGYFIKCGLPCCTCGLKKPEVLVLAKRQCLFVKDAASFPFKEGYVPGPICAVYGFQCVPNVGCCKPPIKGAGPVNPAGGAPAVEMMER